MSRIAVIRIGTVPGGVLEPLPAFLEDRTGVAAQLLPHSIHPGFAYVRDRGQYDCRPLIEILEARAPAGDEVALGVADVDLFSAMFTFVFGEARLAGRAGIFSIHRLRKERYGLPADPAVLEARSRREALHETGHLLGLIHCREPGCVMRFSPSAEEVDLKDDRFCPRCSERLRQPAVERSARAWP